MILYSIDYQIINNFSAMLCQNIVPKNLNNGNNI